MMLKDQLSKYNHYRVSRYFDYIDLGFGSQFNYYFPQMFLQRGLLPKDIIRDAAALKDVLILNLFPDDANGKGIFQSMEVDSSIPDAVREKYNLEDSLVEPEGSNIQDQINSTISSFQDNLLESKSKLKKLSFVDVIKRKKRKRANIRRLKKLIKSKQFKRELRDLRELVKLSKQSELRSRPKVKYASGGQVKRKMKNLKHKVLPILLKEKLLSKSKKLKQLSLNSSVFFEKKCKSKKMMKKSDLENEDNGNSISVSNYLVDKKVKGRSRINQYNWALIGFSKLRYK